MLGVISEEDINICQNLRIWLVNKVIMNGCHRNLRKSGSIDLIIFGSLEEQNEFRTRKGVCSNNIVLMFLLTVLWYNNWITCISMILFNF